METIRTAGKMLPTHMDTIMNKSKKLGAAHHPPNTHTPTIVAASKYYFYFVIIRSFLNCQFLHPFIVN